MPKSVATEIRARQVAANEAEKAELKAELEAKAKKEQPELEIDHDAHPSNAQPGEKTAAKTKAKATKTEE